MSLQFYFGPSGAGKSYQLHKDMLEIADREPRKNILILVPDQFTMQSQYDLVSASRNKGIMNIDVLSFGRLGHRIFEETGSGKMPVLDDTGKSLVLRRVALLLQDELPKIGPNLSKIGYIHEVKSALSEFMQYGISPDQVGELAEYAKDRKALHYKLKDLQLLYQGFQDYIRSKFITTEETLDLLTEAVAKSEIVKDSIVVFDGFTGFTPIQYRLIQRLLELTDKVIISITLDTKEDPYRILGEQELFYLSKKTVGALCRLAEESGVEKEADRFLGEEGVYRFRENGELAHLEKHLFRYPLKSYEGTPENIHLAECSNPAMEARWVCMQIKELVLSGGYCFRDIAVVAGDLQTYGSYLEREGGRYEIPMFLDKTRELLLNPFIEFIRSALKICLTNFSYDAVFHYLRSGMTDFTLPDVDELENYVLALDLKGKRKWGEAFTRRPAGWAEEEAVKRLEKLNRDRIKLLEGLAPLLKAKGTMEEYVRALYAFVTAAKAEEKLQEFAGGFAASGLMEKAREYGQIYRLVMELLEQMEGLLGEEELSLQEFTDILEAGFAEIEIGIIPGSVDKVLAGDMERTRIKQVKVLFFLGVNDGNIPGASAKGGIISDIDREFLQKSQMELAPTPRQQMYIQRLYLYMNLTKPSEKLYISYARVGSEGSSLRPSYLIGMLKKLYAGLGIVKPETEMSRWEQMKSWKDSLFLLADGLRRYSEGGGEAEEEEVKELAGLLHIYREQEEYGEYADRLLEAAFYRYQHSPLSRAVAKALYGHMLESSVSRLERYAACAYAHFLEYGMRLKEREEYSFEKVDLGNVYHAALELFSRKLADSGLTWFTFTREQGLALLRESLTESTVNYGETILYSNARYEYMTERIYRILARTVFTLQKQLAGGKFVPKYFEMSFSGAQHLDAVNIALSETEKMRLRGRIDRIDTCEDEEHVYVKVVDYKSGSRSFDLAALYYGLQLQLVVYMNVAGEYEQKQHPDKEAVPAALLYYRVADPLISSEEELTPEEINEKLLKELRMTGIVKGEEEIVSLLDQDFTEKSLLIPVERKKEGGYSARSSVIASEDYRIISEYVDHQIREMGQGILKGSIAMNPCETGTADSCTYCAYRGICDFNENEDGYVLRRFPKKTEEELLGEMREKLQEKDAGRKE